MSNPNPSVVRFRMTGDPTLSIVSFEGPVISVGDLKQAVISQRNLVNENSKMAFDLKITDEETGHEYVHQSEFIKKNTQMMIKRIAVRGKAGRIKKRLDKKISNDGSSLDKPLPSCVQPQDYICRKCGEPGHNIKQCPNENSGLTTKSYAFTQRQQTSFINPTRVQYDASSKQQQQQQQSSLPLSTHIDDESLNVTIPSNCSCGLCHSWLTRATVLTCCQTNVCQGCFQQQIAQSSSGSFPCPSCSSIIDPSSNAPNPRLDKIVAETRLHHKQQREQQLKEQQIREQQLREQQQQYQPPPPPPQQQPREQQQQQQQQNNNRFSDVKCRNCEQVGHYPSHCPNPLRPGVWIKDNLVEQRRKWLQDQGLGHIVDAPPPRQQQQGNNGGNNSNNNNGGFNNRDRNREYL